MVCLHNWIRTSCGGAVLQAQAMLFSSHPSVREILSSLHLLMQKPGAFPM